jgi:serine/threonine-protein kinase SIK2
MLIVDPSQRYTINDVKNHPWLMLTDSNLPHLPSQTQSLPNCQLTNAILDHAESLGYNRTQILKSVNGNSYDSDAAIWHLLLEKFQQTCQINSKSIFDLFKEKHLLILLFQILMKQSIQI